MSSLSHSVLPIHQPAYVSRLPGNGSFSEQSSKSNEPSSVNSQRFHARLSPSTSQLNETNPQLKQPNLKPEVAHRVLNVSLVSPDGLTQPLPSTLLKNKWELSRSSSPVKGVWPKPGDKAKFPHIEKRSSVIMYENSDTIPGQVPNSVDDKADIEIKTTASERQDRGSLSSQSISDFNSQHTTVTNTEDDATNTDTNVTVSDINPSVLSPTEIRTPDSLKVPSNRFVMPLPTPPQPQFTAADWKLMTTYVDPPPPTCCEEVDRFCNSRLC